MAEYGEDENLPFGYSDTEKCGLVRIWCAIFLVYYYMMRLLIKTCLAWGRGCVKINEYILCLNQRNSENVKM